MMIDMKNCRTNLFSATTNITILQDKKKPAAAVKVKIEIKPQYNRHSTTTEVFLCLNKKIFEFKTIL